MAYGEEDAERVEGTKPEAAPEAESEKKQTEAQRYAEAELAAALAADGYNENDEKPKKPSRAELREEKKRAYAEAELAAALAAESKEGTPEIASEAAPEKKLTAAQRYAIAELAAALAAESEETAPEAAPEKKLTAAQRYAVAELAAALAAESKEGTPEIASEAESEKKQTAAQRYAVAELAAALAADGYNENGEKPKKPSRAELREEKKRAYAEAELAAALAEDEKGASKQKAEDAFIAFAHGGKRNAFASEEKEVYGREAAAEYYANAADPLHSNISDRKLRRAADAYISEIELASDVEGADLSADERQLRLICAASEALERSKALSGARKEELLAAAKQATKHSDDKKKQKKLDRMTASAAKREAKNADRALEEDKKNLALLERNRDMAEAKALAAEQEAADAMERVSALRTGASNKKKLEAYSEALSASARAESARLTADTLAAEYESEKEKAIERQKAKAAMLAFAAVASAEYENSKGMPLSGSDKRKLNTAISGAQRRYDRALLASRNAEARLSLLADAKASSSRLAAARRDAAKAEVLAADAQQRLNTLLATREATECSKALSRREKAELLALAIAVTEKNDEKLKARLKKSVAAALRKEEKAARRFEKHFDRNMDRYEKRAAETEAEARVAADFAAKAKAKADKLAEKKAETEALHAAYEYALCEQSLAAEARAVADSARFQRDIEKRRAEAYKEAGEAMLALSATLTARDNEQKNSKKQAAIVLCETRKLDAAIEDANRKLEAAEKRSIAAAKNELELLERKRAKKSEIMAAHATYLEAREEAERANSKKEMLEKARIAAEGSKALKAEEKAELLSLATELSADEKNTLKAELLKKKIEYAAQKEALAEKKLAEAVSRREDSLEIQYLYQEAKAHIAEESANEKKKKAERLARRRVNKKAQKKAYKDALLEQARAERERERAEELKAKRLAKKEKSEQYKESAAAMLAFAAAFAPIDKKKKTKAKEEQILSTVLGKSSYTGFIGTEITEAEKQYENAILAEEAARARVRALESERSTKKERKAALLAVGLAEEETIRAERRLEKLEAAKRAAEKSKELSPEEKAEMLALAASAKTAAKSKKAARKAQKKLLRAEMQKSLAEGLAADEAALAAKLKVKQLAEEEKSAQQREEIEAMLAFAAALAPIEKKKKVQAKEEKVLGTVLGKSSYTGFIGTEITEAEKQYENAILAEEAARARVRALESERSTKKERKAALLAVGLAEEETIRAERRLEKLEAAKRAAEKLEKDEKISPEEKAEMLALAASANAASKRERAALKKQKSAVKTLKQEARAEKRAARRTQSQLRDWEKKVAKAEATAIVSEERKALAKSKAKQARLEKKSEKALERAYKEALVSEYKADKARRKADAAQAARQSKREKEARIAEHKEAELAMLAFAAAMDKESKRGRREKNALLREVILEERRKEIAERRALADEAKARRKSKLEERSAKEVELYARALERKAMRAEQKALLLVPVKGKAKKKLKAYEAALFDRAEADEARTLANTLNGEDAAPVAIAAPLSRKAQKLQQSADEALNKQKKAHKRLNAEARYADKVARRKDESLQKKYDSKMKKLQKRASKADLAAEMAQMKLDAQLYKDGVKHEPTASAQVQNTEAQASQPKHAYVDKADRRLQKKQQKEAFAREKKELKREFKRYVIESRVQKRDLNALRKAALAGRIKDERLARKLQYEQKVEQKQRVKDEKAWKALEKHDEKLTRHYSYMSLLELDRRDQERLKAKAEEQKTKKLAPAAAPEDPLARGIFTKKLTRRERLARNRAYKKRDIKTLKARYDIVIAEAKRDLELALCDLSCTKANAKRIEAETKKRIWKLCANKRRALQNEKVDNHRYFRCLRKSRIKPKNYRVDRAELARLYEKLERLLEMRDKVNESLYTVYSYDSYKKLGRVDTPWHKAFMREKKRWHKKLRPDLRVIDSMNLSRRDKQKLRADLDCVATSHADIVETKCRIQKQKLKGAAKRLQKQEIKAMKRDAIKAHNHMKRKMNIARAKADKREFWYVSMLSLAITLSLICICVLGWHFFGDKIMGFMNANFPSIVTKIKSLLK